MEGDSHDPVGQVKGFLDTVSMVNVYVDIQNSGVVSGDARAHTHKAKSVEKFGTDV